MLFYIVCIFFNVFIIFFGLKGNLNEKIGFDWWRLWEYVCFLLFIVKLVV